MEVLGDLLRWWQALSVRSRMAYTIVSVTVIATLGTVIYQGYSGMTAVPLDTVAANRSASPTQSKSLFSLPLPGTTQRRQAEAAQLVESTLSDFDYIANARAIFAVSPPETQTVASPHLSLQLQFQPTLTPPDNWLDNLIAFVLHTVPDLRPADLLIADSHGEILYAKGQPTPAAVRIVSRPSTSPMPISEPKAVLKTPIVFWGLVALLSIALAAVYLRQARRGSQHDEAGRGAAATEPPSLEQFLSGLTARQITSLVKGERPEVVAALLHHVSDSETATVARHQMNALPGNLPEPTRLPREEVFVSFTNALRTKLAATQNTFGNSGDHNE